jgi:hypothetical protein
LARKVESEGTYIAASASPAAKRINGTTPTPKPNGIDSTEASASDPSPAYTLGWLSSISRR